MMIQKIAISFVVLMLVTSGIGSVAAADNSGASSISDENNETLNISMEISEETVKISDYTHSGVRGSCDFRWYGDVVWSEKSEYRSDEDFIDYAQFANYEETSSYTVYFYLYDPNGNLIDSSSKRDTLEQGYYTTWTALYYAPGGGWNSGNYKFCAKVVPDKCSELSKKCCYNKVKGSKPTFGDQYTYPFAPDETERFNIYCDVYSSTTISSVKALWSTDNSNWHTIDMKVYSGDTYITKERVPAQPAGTTVYYKITATNAGGTATSKTVKFVVEALDPLPKIDGTPSYPSSICLGKIAEITLYGKNYGGEASEAYLSVSFPDNPSYVEITSSDASNRKVYRKGDYPLFGGYGSYKLTAKYPLAEVWEVPWKYLVRHYQTVEVKPEKAGTFTFNVKMTAKQKNDGWFADPGVHSSYPIDQQDEHVYQYKIQVKQKPSAPTLSAPSEPCADKSYEISWRSVSGATEYKLYENGALKYKGSDTYYWISGHSSGSYTYYVQACNSCGCSPNSNSKTVSIKPKPAAKFSGSPTSGCEPLTVKFDGSSSTGEITSYSWDFGDGSPAGSGKTVSHTYSKCGDYTVKLAVTGSCGSDTETKTNYIHVTPPKKPILCTTPDPPDHNFGNVPEGETRNWDFKIQNCGEDTLTWSVSDDQPWITVSPTRGTTTTETDTVTVSIDTTGLKCGVTHTGTLTVTSNGGTKTGEISVYVPEEEKLSVSITTDKTSYKPGDTMTVTIGVKNPTASSVDTYFVWYFYWMQIMATPYTLPPNFDQSYEFSIPVEKWVPFEFDGVWYVALLETTPPYKTICEDTAEWKYELPKTTVGEGETTPAALEEIAKEIKKTVERAELPGEKV